MSDHPAIAEHPIWVAHCQTVAEADERIAAVQAQFAQAHEQQADTDEEYDAELTAARASGGPVPPRPAPVPVDHLQNELLQAQAAQRQVRERRQEVLAEVAAAGGVEALQAAMEESMARARDIAPGVREIVDEVRSHSRLMALFLAAEDRERRVQPPRATQLPEITIGSVMEAAEHGRSLLDLVPSLPNESRVMRGDDEGFARRALGLQPGATFADH